MSQDRRTALVCEVCDQVMKWVELDALSHVYPYGKWECGKCGMTATIEQDGTKWERIGGKVVDARNVFRGDKGESAQERDARVAKAMQILGVDIMAKIHGHIKAWEDNTDLNAIGTAAMGAAALLVGSMMVGDPEVADD